jgi:hypothetical protein
MSVPLRVSAIARLRRAARKRLACFRSMTTWNAVHELNARHALDNKVVTQEAALDLLRRNSAAAAAAIRALSDEELARAAAISLNADAPLMCQFMLEDHAVRHSYHHLAKMREALRSTTSETLETAITE